MTAMVYAACLGDFDYVYVMELCPKQMKVRSLRMVWNDEYTRKEDPGAYFPKAQQQQQQQQQQVLRGQLWEPVFALSVLLGRHEATV